MLADCEPPKEGKMKQYKRGVQYANIGIADVTVGHNDGFVEQSTQNSAANAAQATNDPIVQNAFVGHNDQSTQSNHIATQSSGAPTLTARPLECSVSLYGLLKLNHTTNQTLTANANQYLMCRVDIASQSAYKTVTRAVVKLRQSYCSGSVFPVLPSSANHNILQNYEELNGLDTVVEDGVTYKLFDIGSYLKDNTSKTLYFAIDAVNNSTFTATSASLEIQYVEEDDLAVNGAELNYSVGAKGSYSVNVRNGKLLYSHALHSAPGNLLPLSLSLNYNVGDIALANKGWSFGYEQVLRQSGANYIYRDGAGRNHRFTPSHNDATVYNDVTSRTGLILYPVDDEWEISDGKTTTLRFNNSKRLRLITVAKGSTPQTTTITYNSDGKIASVVDGMGTTYDFDRTVNGQVTIKRGTTALVTVTYDASGNPTKIANCLDSADYTDFTYDSATKLLATITDNASRNKAVLGYNNIGNVLSACNYVVSGGKANATECYHLCYKFLHTYVKFCRNTDLESKAYKSYDYQFAEDGELLSAAEEKASDNLSGVRFRTKDDYSRYTSAVASAPLAVFKTDDNKELSLNNGATGKSANITSATVAVDTTNVPNEYFVFSALASITGGGSATNATQKIQARLTDGVDGNVILAKLDFDPSQRTKQVQATTVCLNRGIHNLAVKLLISGTTASITLKDVRLTVANGGAQTEVSNINTRMQNFSEHSSAGVKVWYKAAPVNLIAEHSKIELLSEVKFTVKDFNLTKLSYIKNPQNFNVWYNDGADLLYGVSALSVAPYVGSGDASNISVIKYGTVTESIGTKTFTYMLPTDTAGEYKVVTAIDDGTTAKTTEQMFNSYCLPTSTTDYNGITQSTSYDQYGNVVTEKTSATPSATMNITKDYGYSAGGKLLTSEKTYRGTTTYTTSHAYDEHNYPAKDTFPNGKYVTYNLNNSKEKILSMTSFNGGSSPKNIFTYNGDLVTNLAHGETTYDFVYDERNNISTTFVLNCYFSHDKHITYNEDGSCKSKTMYGNDQVTTKYYDKYDRLVKVTETVGGKENVILAYIYSDEEVANSVTDPFDPSLKVSESSPLRVEISDGVRTTYTYDNSGQLVKTTNSSVTVENTEMDDFNRVKQHKVSVEGAALATTTYTYENNVDQTLKREITQSGSGSMFNTSYERDTLQRPSKTTVVYGVSGYETDYYYAPRQKKIQSSSSGGFGQVGFGDEEIVNIGTTSLVNEIAYYKLATNGTRTLDKTERVTYDANGNITQYGDVTYKYDLCGRLVREDNPTIDKTIVWTYNDGSNITQRKEYAYTTSDTLGVPTRIFALDYDGGWGDQVTAIEKQPVEYDYAGNPTNYRGMKLNWTRGRLLLCVEKSSGDYASLYDGNGIRKAQEIWLSNGKFWQYAYHYADGHLVAETRKLGVNVKHKIRYFYNQQGVIGMEYDDTHYLYRKNLFGDITAIYERDTCVAKYAYDAYGVCKVLNPDGTENTDEDFIGNVNPIRYRGYYYDVGTGFYYLQTRYYDPQTGRFINMDGLEYLDPETVGGLNLYAYCNCNPVMYVDPTGTIATLTLISIIVVALFAIAGTAIGVTKVCNDIKQESADDKNLTEEELKQKRTERIWRIIGGGIVGLFAGAATGGFIVALGGILIKVGLIKVTSAYMAQKLTMRAVAIGLLAVDAFAAVIGPLVGITMECIGIGSVDDAPEQSGVTRSKFPKTK